MALSPETLSHYSVGALIAMPDLMTEIRTKWPFGRIRVPSWSKSLAI